MDKVTQHIGWVVTEDMNKELVGDFTHNEVKLALNLMAPLKAPGPDGMPPIFLLKLLAKYWRGSHRCSVVLFKYRKFFYKFELHLPYTYS